MKVCRKCKINKEISEFNTNFKMKDGHLNSCKKCCSENFKLYREKNKDKMKLSRKIYIEKNKGKIYSSEYHKKYYNDNRDKKIEYQRKSYADNIDCRKEYARNYRRLNKQKRKEYHNNRKENDVLYRLTLKIRSMINSHIIKKGFSKSKRTQEILGISFKEFKIYLESKFETWMNWENSGLYNGEFNYGWDIDHISPLSSATSGEELIMLNHYKNLQPLCSKVNRDIKRDRRDFS